VTEVPGGDDSLFNKPCKEGYNSHYVLVKNRDPTNQLLAYEPCHPELEIPDYDEVVVFNPDQVLPRYLVYCERVPDQLDENCICWISSDDNSQIISELESKKAFVLVFNSTPQFISWRTKYPDKPVKKIVSTDFRENDGEESAGVRLYQWHLQNQWSQIPFIRFCKDMSIVKDVPKGVPVTSSEKELLEWILK